MLAKIKTATLIGIEATVVEVEVEVCGGLPGFHLVGLPMSAVKEGAVRIRAALHNYGCDLNSSKITVNLAPADVRKEGTSFDLPIALAILIAKGIVAPPRKKFLVAGELSLDGSIKAVRGALSLAEVAKTHRLDGLLLPQANAKEGAILSGLEVFGLNTLTEAVAFLAGQKYISPTKFSSLGSEEKNNSLDFSEVIGQAQGKLAAEIAAAGGHNLLLIGPPGAGKTMIARRLSTILPPMSEKEVLSTTKIYSVAGLLGERPLIINRPFRAPHHTCSGIGLVGGGNTPRPGEISLAHNGVLFLDELPEFSRFVLESLRQPLESGEVTIVRSQQAVTFPARYMLAAAMNPCPCGWRGSGVRTCVCGEKETLRYLSRLSGPFLDRLDLFVRLPAVQTRDLLEAPAAEPSASIFSRVAQARARQKERLVKAGISCNAQMSNRLVKKHAHLDKEAKELLAQYAESKQLSGRALYRTCKVARTVADLASSDDITAEHLLSALLLQQARQLHQTEDLAA